MRSRAVWALLLLACATQKPQAQAQSTALPPPPVQAPAEPRTDDQICQADGFDFAYPFIEHNGIREIPCGIGPGTSCSGNSCAETKLLHCQHGKLGMIDCLEECRDIGDGSGQTYDSGTCRLRDGMAECACCDAGEPGCETVKPRPRRPIVPLSRDGGEAEATPAAERDSSSSSSRRAR